MTAQGIAAFKVGQTVQHSKFGTGTVAEIEGNKVVVDFQGCGRKKLANHFLNSPARNHDANDVARLYGNEAVRDAIAGAKPAPESNVIDWDARREKQRAENMAIGEGSADVPLARIYSLDEMIAQFVFIKDGSQVAPIARPHGVLALTDFRNALAGSKHWTEVEGRRKARPAVLAWLEHPERMEAEALTFRAGGQRMTAEPESGKAALNIWAPVTRPKPPADWRKRAQAFVQHIEWLWGAEAEPFLNWLAHIEQRPGILPHYGWVHISREHGKGRNWVSSVLTRLWPGYVAASLDLPAILEGGFNGRLSRKLLAIVDEINEGGNASYRHAQKLREIVTAEHRPINPKYGRTRVEYNSCRWLMFSNHTGALPLTEDDRRFWIVAHEGKPKLPAYYEGLYRDLLDPLFIASVAEFLARRDLSKFKPGERPPMNAAKRDLVEFGQSEDDLTLRAIAARWPVDLITNLELRNNLDGDGPDRPAVRHALAHVGFRRLPIKVRVNGQGSQRVHSVRHHGKWQNARHDLLKAEIERADPYDKSAALDPEDCEPSTGGFSS